MKRKKHIALLILFVSFVISLKQHSPFINLDIQGIHSWRQSQTMWNVRNFVRHDNSILNPRVSKFNGGQDNILRYEFPLMQWGIAQLQKVFGEKIAVVRLSVFFIGLFSLVAFAFIVKDIFDDWFVAVFSAILLQYSPVFYYYTINPIPDNLALAFSFAYLLFVLRHRRSKRAYHLILASISLLFATLCKLPFLMISIVSIWFFLSDVLNGKKLVSLFSKYALPQLFFILPAIAWYAWVMPGWSGNPILSGQWNEGFVLSEYLEILEFQVAVMFPRKLLSIPIWIVIAIGTVRYYKNWRKHKWLLALVGISFLYLFLEFKPIGKVHDYYMFPFLLWLFVLVAFGVARIMKHKHGLVIMCLICVISSVHTSLKKKKSWGIEKSHFNTDLITYSEELKNAVDNDERCIILNDISGYIFSYKIDKMGYVFNSDNLPLAWIEGLVENDGVRFMYSDSRKVDSTPEFQELVERVVMERGTIRVFELKKPEGSLF